MWTKSTERADLFPDAVLYPPIIHQSVHFLWSWHLSITHRASLITGIQSKEKNCVIIASKHLGNLKRNWIFSWNTFQKIFFWFGILFDERINFNYAKFVVFSSGSRFPWFFSFLPAHSGSFLSTFFLSVRMRHRTECQPEQYGEEPTQTGVFEPSSSVYSGPTLKTATQTQWLLLEIIISTLSHLYFFHNIHCTSIQKSIAQNGLPQSLFLLFLIFKRVYEHIKVFYNIAIFNTLQRKDFLWNFSATWPLDLHP